MHTLDSREVSNLHKAIENAVSFADEVLAQLPQRSVRTVSRKAPALKAA